MKRRKYFCPKCKRIIDEVVKLYSVLGRVECGAIYSEEEDEYEDEELARNDFDYFNLEEISCSECGESNLERIQFNNERELREKIATLLL